jgi:hypothetical protein
MELGKGVYFEKFESSSRFELLDFGLATVDVAFLSSEPPLRGS